MITGKTNLHGSVFFGLLLVGQAVTAQQCVDHEPLGDGWGWDGQRGCLVSDSGVELYDEPDQACRDDDGDGWGWDGEGTCRVKSGTADRSAVNDQGCIDQDGDGWGWDGTGTCRIGSETGETNATYVVDQDCVDPDGDGWGWDGAGTCPVESETADISAVSNQGCIDHDGDGWGWDGQSTCRTGTADRVSSDQVFVAECVDMDGDGWGWNGAESCEVTSGEDDTKQAGDTAVKPVTTGTDTRAVSQSTAWELVQTVDGSMVSRRHEASAVAVDGKLYLLGGRGNRPVNRYDPKTNKWRNLGKAPAELNHFQAVAVGRKIYVIGAFSGTYPDEAVDANIRVFDTRSHDWSIVGQMPRNRLRGSMGAVAYNNKIYLVAGNTNGHRNGAVDWFDEYDPQTRRWRKLANAPHRRDHFSAVVVDDTLVVAGGRRSAYPDTFSKTVGPVNLYEFKNRKWNKAASLPTHRGGTMAVTVGSEALIIGGEAAGARQAKNHVEAFDLRRGSWRRLQPLMTGRHSGGAAVVGQEIHVISGNTRLGGGHETTLHERLSIQ